ncbi:MAG: type II secretion system minor pseudopilin GspK [Geobacteraceae bacterium]|nr:type II secretion system minor pseudopilin GspK [Geobacteraceae bacterium]
MRCEKGFALVLTLIVTALMVAVLVEMIHQVSVDVSISRGYRDGQQASLLAESGVTGGTKLLQLGLQGKNYTSLSDVWAAPIKLDDETGTMVITITEESGKLCLNDLVQPNGYFEPNTLAALKRLGRRLNIPEDCWNALADWIDSDDSPRTNGAESSYYQTLKPPYAARNAKLETLAELSLVRGFTPEYIAALRPFVTVYAEQPGAPESPVNINTAPKEVLMALDDGIDDRMAERILEERRLKPFNFLGDLSRISGGDTIASNLAGKASVQGKLFRITSVAQVRETARTVEAVLRVSGGSPEVLSWQEY